ncbi:MAG TPA: DUF3631 domain-containing protein [Blastocatellia bacterium]|nr:DUF3631 domain-containing protein [Blastocatellia bacterium]
MSVFALIREQVELADVAARFRSVKRAGRSRMGRCPLPSHRDSTASFCVFSDGHWRCFGCQQYGDVIDLWAEVRGLARGIEAALDLAREYGITLPSRDPQAEEKAQRQRQREAEYIEQARQRHQLLDRHAHITEYLERRGFTAELRERFLLGATPDGAAASIPYWHRGRVVGLIRRLMKGEPKYLFPSADKFSCGYKPLFIPGATHGDKYLVEGIFDALALAALDLSAIAVGGCGISQNQNDELARLSGSIYLLRDNDDAGEKAGREWVRGLYPRARLCPSAYGANADGTERKDIADLFAANGEVTRQVIDDLKAEAKDALDVVLAEAPKGTTRDHYRYARDEVLPLIIRLDDEGERSAAVEDAAAAMKLKVGELRKAIKVETAEPEAEPEPKNGLNLSDPELWPDAVDGAALLDEIVTLCRRFVAAVPAIFDAVALWCLYAYVFDAFEVSPLLVLTSPQKRCGKTTLLMLIDRLVPRALSLSNITAAALFRTIEKYHPVLVIDEADSFMTDNEELRGIINSGHRKAMAYVIRTTGDDHEPQRFTTWTPKVIALIGHPPDTIEDRSLIIKMQRKRVSEAVEELRLDRLVWLGDLRRRAARWAADNVDTLKAADPIIPDIITNARARDNWRPLLAIADAVGGDWPERARAVATLLAGSEAAAESAGILVLQDLRVMFDEQGEQVTSDEIVKQLAEMESRPWGEWKNGKPISKVGLARLLRQFEIKPTHWRNGGVTERGYQRGDFEEVFARYIGFESAQSAHAQESMVYSEIESAHDTPSVPTANARNPLEINDVPSVPTQNGGNEATNGKRSSVRHISEILADQRADDIHEGPALWVGRDLGHSVTIEGVQGELINVVGEAVREADGRWHVAARGFPYKIPIDEIFQPVGDAWLESLDEFESVATGVRQ